MTDQPEPTSEPTPADVPAPPTFPTVDLRTGTEVHPDVVTAYAEELFAAAHPFPQPPPPEEPPAP